MWKLAGDLTVNGVTKPVVLDVEFNGTEDFHGTLHAGFSATGELKRSDFGIDFGMMPMGGDKLMLADKVPFELDLQFLEPKAGEPGRRLAGHLRRNLACAVDRGDCRS